MAAFVSSSSGLAGTSTTTVASAALSVTSGNLLVVTVTSQEAALVPSTVTGVADTAGNTWTACTAQSSGASGEFVQVWYAYNVTGNAANVVTATFSAATRYKTIVQQQFSGADTTSGVLEAQSVGGVIGAATVTSGGLTTTGDAIIVSGSTSSNDRSWTAGTGFTEVYDALITDGTSSGQAQYLIQAGAGTYTADAAASSSSNLSIAAAAFKAIPSSPTITAQPTSQRVPAGQTASFTVSATPSAGSLTYQWQENTGGTFANISGQTSTTYTTGTLTAGTAYAVRCVVTDSNGTTNTNAADVWTPAVEPAPWAGLYLRSGGRDFVRAYLLNPTGESAGPVYDSAIWGEPTAGSVSASVAVTEGADTLAAAVAPIVSASSATTDGADVLAANVDPVSAAVSASVAVTDGADALAAAVSPIVGVTSATTDGADTLAAAVAPVVGVASATTDGADGLAAAVAPIVGVTSATTDGADVLAAAVDTAVGAVSASSATTDGADVLAAVVGPVVGVSAGLTEGADTLAAQVAPIVGLSSNTTDGADTLSALVDPVPSSVGASVAVTEGADTLSAAVDTGTPAGGSLGFEINGDEPPKPPKRRGVVYVIEDDKARASTADEPELSASEKLARFTTAREQAEEIIRAAAEDHAASRVSKQVRYGNIRTSLKPLAPVLGNWNWINLYQRIYNEALVQQLREEIALEDAIDEDGAIAFLLLNL